MKSLQKFLSGIALLSSAFLGFANKSFSQQTTTTLETILAKPHVKEILSHQVYVPKMNGRIIYVDDDNTTGTGTLEDPYNKIQRAIDNAVDGDEIIVEQGRYLENININGKNIILRSTNPTDPNIIAETIIDGNQAGSVVTFSGNESTSCTLEGLTITNGKAATGGGIDGGGTSTNATVQNNIIFGNTAYHIIVYNPPHGQSYSIPNGKGGGICLCEGAIQNNIIYGNQSNKSGGGLYGCNGLIQNNLVSNNSSDDMGGGIDFCLGTIQNNLVVRNSAGRGGGIANSSTIKGNTIYGNFGGGVESGGLTNNIIWGNFGYQVINDYVIASYSDIQDWTQGGVGNISLDPQFVDSINGDYHLRPYSPCIDAGMTIENLLTDIENNPRGIKGVLEQRGDGSNYDIGAVEYNPSKSVVDSKIWEMYE